MRRTLSWAAVVLTALLLQSTLFARFRLGGAKPDLVFLVTIVLAYLEGPTSGTVAGGVLIVVAGTVLVLAAPAEVPVSVPS